MVLLFVPGALFVVFDLVWAFVVYLFYVGFGGHCVLQVAVLVVMVLAVVALI